MTRRHVERALSAGVVVLGLAGAYWLHVQSNIEWKPEALRDYVAALGFYGPIAVVAIMTFRPFLGLPTWLVLLACGMLFGPWLGALYGSIGGLLGGALIFGMARAFGRDAVQARQGIAQRKRIGATLGDRHVREAGVPEDAAFDVVHHVEPGADDRIVGAQRISAWHRHVSVPAERRDDLVFAIDCMR